MCATAGGDCTLRAAIQEANALPGNDTITLPAGTYTLTIAGAGEYDAASGDLNINGNLTIIGAGAATTIIDGNGGVTGDRVFEVRLGNVTITGVTIQNGNPGSGAIGGAIYNMSTLTITDSIIAGNSAGNGGAIYNDDPGTLTLINSTVTGNTATLGHGAIYNRGAMTLTNSTVSGNNTISVGGGIVVASGSTVNMNNVTITNNTANGSGGIHNAGGTVNFKNTLIAGNTSNGAGPDCAGTLTSQGYNLIQNPAGCTIAGDTTGNVTGQNPILGPLQDNGGPTFTHLLLSGSPAIDAGNPAAPGSGGNACESGDQRGVTRPQGAHCDIGAVEISFRLYLPLILREPPMFQPHWLMCKEWQVTVTSQVTVTFPHRVYT